MTDLELRLECLKVCGDLAAAKTAYAWVTESRVKNAQLLGDPARQAQNNQQAYPNLQNGLS